MTIIHYISYIQEGQMDIKPDFSGYDTWKCFNIMCGYFTKEVTSSGFCFLPIDCLKLYHSPYYKGLFFQLFTEGSFTCLYDNNIVT